MIINWLMDNGVWLIVIVLKTKLKKGIKYKVRLFRQIR